jgi:hypothetical protein
MNVDAAIAECERIDKQERNVAAWRFREVAFKKRCANCEHRRGLECKLLGNYYIEDKHARRCDRWQREY